MKIIYLVVALLLFSCGDNDSEEFNEIPLNAHFLIGSWQLNGSKISIGGPLPEDFTPIVDGNVYTFKSNSSYVSKTAKDSIIDRGTYEFMDGELFFMSDDMENELFSFSVRTNSEHMVWSPTGPYLCTEGCLYRYKKLD